MYGVEVEPGLIRGDAVHGASIHNEEARARSGRRAVRRGVVRDLVAHARGQLVGGAIRELGIEFALEAEQEMSLRAPVIGEIAGGVIHHAHAHVTKHARAPVRLAAFTRMARAFDARPVDDAEGDGRDLQAGQYLPASTAAKTSVSTLPPVTATATRWPRSDSRS